ncbi:uncharacterized protein LOC122968712 [Scomber scombrus]|uniref:Uncharacterized protein LOC122968712 n=1 Tax=Scomber scombrus TaxID=13677 RepID=A0AAV1P0I5_SCOSC|nr:uncharacterized protein LOC133995757 [Scomber scombrus]
MRNIRVSRMLQLSFVLMGLCQARRDHPPGDPSASQESGEVPVSQLKMLSLGLAHLLKGVEENAGKLEQQGERVATELDGATRSLESLRKQSLQTGRTHRQVRKDLQVMSARGDRMRRAVRDLQKGMEELETEQEAMQQQMNRILQGVKSLTEPRSEGRRQLNIRAMKVIVDKQSRRLASLTSEVSARDRMIDRRLKHIENLEKQVSENLPAVLQADCDTNCVQ